MPSPPVPAHKGRPALPCGCRMGEPCPRYLALQAAYLGLPFGSREWAEAREAWNRHRSGEEARSGRDD